MRDEPYGARPDPVDPNDAPPPSSDQPTRDPQSRELRKRNPMNTDPQNPNPLTPELEEALTRLVLGEVDATERAELEALADANPAAQEFISARTDAVALLRDLATAEAPRLSSSRRDGIFAAPAGGASNVISIDEAPPRTMGLFPFSSLAAAILLSLVALFLVSDPMSKGREKAGPIARAPEMPEGSQGESHLRFIPGAEPDAAETAQAPETPGDIAAVFDMEAAIQKYGQADAELMQKMIMGRSSGEIRSIFEQFDPNAPVLMNDESLHTAYEAIAGQGPNPVPPISADGESPVGSYDLYSHGVQGHADFATPGDQIQPWKKVELERTPTILNRDTSSQRRIRTKPEIIRPGERPKIIPNNPRPSGVQRILSQGPPLSERERALVRELREAEERAKNAVAQMQRSILDRQQMEEALGVAQTELADANKEIKDKELILTMVEGAGIAVQDLVVGSQPRIDGVVYAIKDGMVVLSVGSDEQVREGYTFTIFDRDRFIGKVKVETVMNDMCGARVLFTEPGETMTAGQKATTRLGGSRVQPKPVQPDPTPPALRKYPQINGKIMSIQGDIAVIDLGRSDKLFPGSKFHLSNGDETVAHLEVLHLQDDVAACRIDNLDQFPLIDTSEWFVCAWPDVEAVAAVKEMEEAQKKLAEEQRRAEQRRIDEQVKRHIEEISRRPGESLEDMFFRNWGDNPFVRASIDPLSTFGMDVDTASFSVVRNYLNRSQLPPRAAVRTEEFVNAFPSALPAPTEQDLSITTELVESEFSATPGTALLKIGIKAREVADADRKPISLTFVIDVSGSMNQGQRLELVKQAILTLLPELDARDTIGIVEFRQHGRVVLEPVSALDVDAVSAALLTLQPEGSTNVQQGLDLGYAMAQRQFRTEASNRVVLFSDGVANSGVTDLEALLQRTADARAGGIDFNSFGVGMGNHNDTLMEQLADRGNGICVYLDSLKEAQKYFRHDLVGTFQTVARDAKIQVEFFPENVRRYRQIGYENRAIADKDFRNDTVDAGEVGAGHEVVALYEVELAADASGPIAAARIRYHSDAQNEVIEVEQSIDAASKKPFLQSSEHFQLSAVVAAFAELLRGSVWSRGTTIDELAEIAPGLLSLEAPGRSEIADLIRMLDRARVPLAQRTTSDLDRLLDEVKRNHHLRARIEEEMKPTEGTPTKTAASPAKVETLKKELESLRAQHDQLEKRLRDLLVG